MNQELDRTQSSRAWWRSQLAGLEAALELPADAPRHVARPSSLERRTVPVGGRDGCLAPLELVAAHPSSEVDTAVLLAAVAALCGDLTGRPELALGTAVTGADGRPGLAVLRFRLTAGSSFGELLTQARNGIAEAKRRGPVPADLAPVPDGPWHPFTQVVVAARAPGEVVLDPARLRLAPEAAPFDLAWILDRTVDPAALLLEYEPSRFGSSGPALLRALQSVLARGLGDPGAPLLASPGGAMPLA